MRPARGCARTLYLFTQDKPKRSLCTSDYLKCTTIWLPLMTNGRPLYLSVDDRQPGDLEGQAMYDYWYVLSPSGRPIRRH